MKRKIRMIGFDLDGTMLDSKKRLSRRNKEAVARAAAAGIVILPATGRPQSGIPQEVLGMEGIRYLLSSNGTRIVERDSGRLLYEMRMDHGLTMRLARGFAGVTDGMWELYEGGSCYVDKETYRFVEHPAMTPEMMAYLKGTRCFVSHLLDKMERENACGEKFQAFYENQERKEKILEITDREPEVMVSSSSPYNLEINSAHAGKGNGLIALGELLGIDREEIMGIGDSSNDWDMLKKVGVPVVMANGDGETKELAAFLAPSNDEDGVAQVIDRILEADLTVEW